MFSKTERLLAFRYLRSRKQTRFVSVISGFSFLGIMLGVATLIIVTSVMNGFQIELINRVLGINGHLGVYPSFGSQLENSKEVEKILSHSALIKNSSPVIDGQAMASFNESSQGVMIRGIQPTDFKQHSALYLNYSGLPFSEFSNNYVILGYRLAEKLGIRPHDSITLLSPTGNITAFGTIPRMKSFFVLGTFDSGMFEYDSNFIFMTLSDSQKFFGFNSNISHIEVFLNKTEDTPSFFSKISPLLPENTHLYDWRQTNQAFFNAIEVEKNVMFLILTLIIIVAAFNMISGLIMLVQDKSKDIAILRTIGASKSSILRIFLLSGLTVGFLGTFAGIFLGLLFCYNIDSIKLFLENLSGKELFSAEIYFLSHLPAKVNLIEVFWISFMSIVLSFLATLYPAWKASKMDPVETLRYE